MPRNLDHRVEVLAPVEEPQLVARVRDILERCLADNTFSWELQPDGSWRRRPAPSGGERRNAQAELLERASLHAPSPAGRGPG